MEDRMTQPKARVHAHGTPFCEAPNIRCNRCGKYGANWYHDERPGWGCLALCPEHAHELDDEYKRHYEALKPLRAVNFEQETGTIKALSIREPWISMIADGEKTIETRTWMTSYRGPLLLVGSKKPDLCSGLRSARKDGPYAGKAACMAYLVGCRPMTKVDETAACCEAYPRAKAWLLANIARVEPVYVTGKQGLYNVEKWKIRVLSPGEVESD